MLRLLIIPFQYQTAGSSDGTSNRGFNVVSAGPFLEIRIVIGEVVAGYFVCDVEPAIGVDVAFGCETVRSFFLSDYFPLLGVVAWMIVFESYFLIRMVIRRSIGIFRCSKHFHDVIDESGDYVDVFAPAYFGERPVSIHAIYIKIASKHIGCENRI